MTSPPRRLPNSRAASTPLGRARARLLAAVDSSRLAETIHRGRCNRLDTTISTADQILDSVARFCRRISDSGHQRPRAVKSAVRPRVRESNPDPRLRARAAVRACRRERHRRPRGRQSSPRRVPPVRVRINSSAMKLPLRRCGTLPPHPPPLPTFDETPWTLGNAVY